MNRTIWTVSVPPTKDQLERNIMYYKKELKKLDDPDYVKNIIETMKKGLEDNIKKCERDLAVIIYGNEEY